MSKKKPIVLCIMDGWGINNVPDASFDAVKMANTKYYDKIMSTFPTAYLSTDGPSVGLPIGQMGNSEVGHKTIGSGRVCLMNLPKIDQAIRNNKLDENKKFQKFLATMKKRNGTAHLAGIVSNGGVHGSLNQLIEIAKLLNKARVKVLVHAFLDGRDVAPKTALKDLRFLQTELSPEIKIATISGRYFAMDRDRRWNRIKKVFDAIMHAIGDEATSVSKAINTSYDMGVTDEFFVPTVLKGYTGVEDTKDGLLFLNFRADRAREILSALLDPKFLQFDITDRPTFSAACGLVEYSDIHNKFIEPIFLSDGVNNTLGEWISKKEKTQYRLSETEKFPHVTFFFNGGVENIYPGETRCHIPSPQVATYDLLPEMAAEQVTEKLTQAIESRCYDFILVNYANPDMVGHTGSLKATIRACEAVDLALGEILKAIRKVSGLMLLTSDHGNCEKMFDLDTGMPHTAHTLNKVPIALIGKAGRVKLRNGDLSDVAPTILDLLNINKPDEMTGTSLLVK